MERSENLIQRVNIGDSLTRAAATRPAHLAVVDGDRRWTYAAFNEWVNRLAGGLAGFGYGRGDALALASGNSAEFLAVYYACAKLGVVCVPTNLGWRTDEVAYVLGHSQARGLVVEGQLVAALTEGIAKVPAVADVIVAPGTGPAGEQEPADRRCDAGWFDADGVLWFADRYKDVIKTGGENVASIEVEKAVYACDERIAEAVVVGLPHERWSEAITAVVVPKPGEALDAAELITALAGRLDGFKVPKSVIVADELPKTSTGKIQKNRVREAHATHYGGR